MSGHLFPSPRHAALEEENIRRLRSLTMEERGEMILSCCRTAALIQEGRHRSGLPPVQPVPWPQSTVEFMRKHAANAWQ